MGAQRAVLCWADVVCGVLGRGAPSEIKRKRLYDNGVLPVMLLVVVAVAVMLRWCVRDCVVFVGRG